MLRVAIIGVLALSAGCLRKTEYRCSGDTSCGTSGVCETTGYCSFPDPSCASGRAYSDTAGTVAGRCTDPTGQPMVDADLTMPDSEELSDASGDSLSAVCPAGYAVIAGGESGHLYKLVPGGDGWSAQEAGCQATTTKAHLAVPADLGELTAMDTLATAGSVTQYWVGVEDPDENNVWTNVLGATQTYLPWQMGSPDNQPPGEHCVTALAASHEFIDDKCNLNRAAICECAP
jgi:hypothetical protein